MPNLCTYLGIKKLLYIIILENYFFLFCWIKKKKMKLMYVNLILLGPILLLFPDDTISVMKWIER